MTTSNYYVTPEATAKKVSNRSSFIIFVMAAFFVFVAGTVGGLQIIVGPTMTQSIGTGTSDASTVFANSETGYTLRFVLIAIAFLLALSQVGKLRGDWSFQKGRLAVIWFYGLVILTGVFINPDTLIPSVLQVVGLCAWIAFGSTILIVLGDRLQALQSLVIGYILANILYAIYSAAFLVTDYEKSFNYFNQRFQGPFVTGTATSEVFFAILLVGLILLWQKKYLLGVSIAILSLTAIYATGVRSTSIVSLVIISIFIWKFGGGTSRNRVNPRILVGALVLLLSIYVFLNTEVLQQRFVTNDLLESREDIWSFGIDTLGEHSFLFGVGIRAVFSSGVSTEGYVFQSTIAWHSTWLALLVETGILGFFAYALIVVDVMRYLIRGTGGWAKDLRKMNILSLIASLIALRYLIMSFTEMNLYTALSPGLIFFCSIFGLLLIQLPTDKQQTSFPVD